MKRIVCLTILITAVMAFSHSPLLTAQDGVRNGYQFGYGFETGRGFARGNLFDGRFHHGFHQRIEQPPYFALFPPVYYSPQIVRRPMGVSPFAAPPGITPVEMQAAPQSATIVNPYFKKQDESTLEVKTEKSGEETSADKSDT